MHSYTLLFLGTGKVGNWTSWSSCHATCTIETQQRTRSCYSTVQDQAENTCGSDLVSTMDMQECLNLDLCTQSQLYLADAGSSCQSFCDSKGNFFSEICLKY